MSDEKPPQKVTYLGQVDYRNKLLTFGIKEKDRTRHTYVIGKTGMGKSTLLENMAIQDIMNGEGMCVIDPHGSMAEKLLDYIPKERIDDVIYFAPFDTEYPLGLNVLEKVEFSKRHLVANGLMSAFKKIFGEDRFSDRIQYILNNIILSLLECDGESLLGVNRMLNDKDYRKYVVSNIKDPSVRSFWLEEYAKAGEKYQQEAAPGIQNKIGQFISNPLIRNIIGQKQTAFDVRDVMDNKKILIVNLSKGKVGEGNANLIGSLLITKIYLAAMSRADAGAHNLEKLPPFYFYVDEFQNFANDSFANILSEARKYNLALTVAHQYIEQMTDEVKAAVFGNVGTMITFRVGATDAEAFEKEFAPYFTMDDIVNLSAFQVYLRLMIDGVGSKPFSAKTLDPIKRPEVSYAQEIIERSRAKYAKKLSLAEEEVREWYMPKVVEKADSPADISVPKEVKEVKEFRRDDRPVRQDASRRDERRPSSQNTNSAYGRERNSSLQGEKKEWKPAERITERVPEKREEKKEEKPLVKGGLETVPLVTTAMVASESITHHKEETSTTNTKPLSDGLSLAEKIRIAQEEMRQQKTAEEDEKVLELQKNPSQEVVTEIKKSSESVAVRDTTQEKTTSLKEALLRAMKERESEASSEAIPALEERQANSPLRSRIHEDKSKSFTSQKTTVDSHVSDDSRFSVKTDTGAHAGPISDDQHKEERKEVSADVLNPLIKDEELDTLLRNEE